MGGGFDLQIKIGSKLTTACIRGKWREDVCQEFVQSTDTHKIITKYLSYIHTYPYIEDHYDTYIRMYRLGCHRLLQLCES